MPSLNVAPYIRECIESAINQTLKDIEIICVDAGSTDGTLEILEEYAREDSRVKILKSGKKSYGYQMNLGLDASTGTYIGILETDDWIEPDMYETLWNTAVEHNADLVKSNYYWYTTKQGICNEPFENLKNCPYNKVFSAEDSYGLLDSTPSIWSGIYSREMLTSYGVRFNETPGASFQDTSFHFMVAAVAQRCMLLDQYFLHYRRDNDTSSVHSAGKEFCIPNEVHYIEKFLNAHPAVREKIIFYFQHFKYEKYRWNYTRMNQASQYEFLKLMYQEFSQAQEEGLLREKYFLTTEWTNVNALIQNPVAFFHDTKNQDVPAPEPTVMQMATIEHPLISVIIPIFNVETYLDECIKSVLDQTMSDIELICVDDGSMDGSLEIAKKYAAQDPRVTVVSKVNGGLSSSRNTGMVYARGEYIYFLDSDDYILPNAMEALYRCAKKWDTDILYFGAESFYEDASLEKTHGHYVEFYRRNPSFEEPVAGDVLLMDQLKKWMFRSSVPLQFIKTDFLRDSKIRFKEGIIHEDELFSCLLAVKAQRSLCIADAFYMRRVRANSIITATQTAKKFVGQFIVASTLMANAIHDEQLSDLAREAVVFHGSKILRDAKMTYQELPLAEKKKIQGLLPMEFRSLYKEMCFGQRTNNHSGIMARVCQKLTGFVRCCKDHGLRYTVVYAAKKAVRILKK